MPNTPYRSPEPDRPSAVTILAARFYPDRHGGVETRMWEFSKQLAAFGVDVNVWTENRTGSPDRETLRPRLNVWRAPTMNTGLLWRWQPLLRLRWWYKRFRAQTPDGFIWATDPMMATAAILAGLRQQLVYNPAGCPAAMCHIGAMYPHITTMKLSRMRVVLSRFAYHRAPHVVVSSQNVANQFIRFHGSKQRGQMNVIPPGTNLSGQLPARSAVRRQWQIDPDAFVIGFVGRFDPCKGIDFLLDAFAAADLHPNARLLLAGSGPDEARLRHRVAELGIESQVIWTGALDEPAAAYAAMDVFVLPSVYEAYGLVLIEAMAAGLPVIGRRGDGDTILTANSEIIEHGHTGLITASHDPADLACKLKWMDQNPTVRRRMRHAALAAAQQRSWTRYTEQCLHLLFSDKETNHVRHIEPYRQAA